MVVLADHDWLRAVNDGLWVVGWAHLLVGLHVDGLRPGINNCGARVVDRGWGHIRGNGVNRRASLPALVVVKAGAVAELETPEIGVSCGAESEDGGDDGEEDEFFHGWWWLNFRENPMRGDLGRQIGAIGNQCVAIQFQPFRGGNLPFDPRNRPLAGKVKIGVFLKAEPEGLSTTERRGRREVEQPKVGPKGEGAGATESKNTEGGRATEGRPEGRRSGRDWVKEHGGGNGSFQCGRDKSSGHFF